MTRKDYELIAEALASTRYDNNSSIAEAEQWRRDLEAVASALAEDNPRFDKDRFIAAAEEEK
jgi:hypothetical protein